MPTVYAMDGVVPVVDPTAFVHPTAVLTGDVVVGADCYIGPSASLRADFGRIVVGRGSNVQDNCTVHCFAGGGTLIGERCNVGHGAVLHGCALGDRVLVGMNSVVMDGAEIGDDTLVAALAFVPAAMMVPSNVVLAGIPAKVRRELEEGEKQWKEEGNRDYLNLAVRCRESLEKTEALTELPSEGPRLRVDGSKPLYLTRREKRSR